MRSFFDFKAAKFSAGRIEIRDVVPCLADEPDFTVGRYIRIAGPRVRPGNLPFRNGQWRECLSLLRDQLRRVAGQRNEGGTDDERTEERSRHRTTSVRF